MPYHVTWAHEQENSLEPGHAPRMATVEAPAGIPGALAALRARAAEVAGNRG
jgi:putative hydrolase of the HAD superfamily